MENGSEANEYFYINYGSVSSNPTSGGDVVLDSSLIPVEFPDFPFGDIVPAKSEITVYGVMATPIGRTSGGGSNKARSVYIKFIRGREVMFDPERSGFLNLGVTPSSDGVDYVKGNSVFGFNSDLDDKKPLFFEEPLKFVSGEELNIAHTLEVISGNLNITSVDLLIGLIMKYKKLE